MENDLLIPSFRSSIFEVGGDIGTEFLELGIDQLIDNEIIKAIPVVASIVKIGKGLIGIKERHLIKKLLLFINKVNDGEVDTEKLIQHSKELKENPEKLYKELEYLLIVIDRQLELDKTKVLAKFYLSYIDQLIDWEGFLYLSDILERFVLSDVILLQDIFEKEIYTENNGFDIPMMCRLNSLGLAQYFSGMKVSLDKLSKGSKTANITHLGKVFYELGFQE